MALSASINAPRSVAGDCQARFNRGRTLVTLSVIAVCQCLSCAGPQPLDVAIRPKDQDAYVERLNAENYQGGLAWLKWEAECRRTTVRQVRAEDEQISTTHNPFNARTNPAAVSFGAVIFKFHCARCHGEDAGGIGPALLPGMRAKDFHDPLPRFAATMYGGRPRKWFRVITNGTGEIVQYPDEPPGPAMPAFGEALTREQIWLAITYLQSLNVHRRDASNDNAGSGNCAGGLLARDDRGS